MALAENVVITHVIYHDPPFQNSPFKRQLSLRLNELPSTLARQQQGDVHTSSANQTNNNKTVDQDILKDLGLDNAGLQQPNKPPSHSSSVEEPKNQLSHLYQLSEESQGAAVALATNAFKADKFDTIAEVEDDDEEQQNVDPISSMCQQLSQELSMLSSSSKNDLQPSHQSDEKPSKQESESLPQLESSTSPLEIVVDQDKNDVNALSVTHDNPWDFVPDQPNKLASPAIQTTASNATNNCDSSSGISSTSGHSNNSSANAGNMTGGGGPAFSSGDDWFQQSNSVIKDHPEDPFQDKWEVDEKSSLNPNTKEEFLVS
jgi:hypothetical protein